MKAKRFITIGVWLFVVVVAAVVLRFFVFPAKQQQQIQATGSASQYEHEIALGLDGFSGYSILRSDEFEKELRSRRVRLNLQDDGADTAKRMQKIIDGDLDLAVFTLDSLIKASIDKDDLPATIIMVIDETRGADALVARSSQVPNIQALDDPKARIVATGNSPSEFLSRVVLANFQLSSIGNNWLEGVDGPDQVMSALKKGSSEPRAYALWEPYVSQAKEIDGVEVIFDSSAVRGHIVDVLAARRGFLADNHEVAKSIVESYLTAAFEIRQKPDGMLDLVIEDAKKLGEPLRRPQAESIVNGIVWRNTLENFAHFGLLHRHESGGIPHIEDSIAIINEVLISTGAVPDNNKVVGSENLLYYDRIMRELQSSRFHPKPMQRSQSNTLGAALSSYNDSLEAVRSETELQSLSDQEWNALLAVGQIKAEPISFGRNSTRLFPQGKRDLKRIVDTLRSFPNYYLQVVGHVSFDPPADMSQEEVEAIRKASIDLAQQRADAVMDYLKEIGMHENRLRAVAAPPSRSAQGSVSFIVGQKAF